MSFSSHEDGSEGLFSLRQRQSIPYAACDTLGSVPDRSERVILGLCVAVAVCHVVFYLALSLQRIGYPFELEWMESGSLEHVMRVLRGEALYVAPSVEFVAFPYPPLYYYVSAGVAKVLGPGFMALRVVSLLSSIGVAAIVLRFVLRESHSEAWGWIGAGLFIATWRASGLYLDVARLDSLFALLLVAGVYALRFARGPGGLLGAAFLGAACVMTKQTGAAVFAPLALWCIWADWRAHEGGAETFRNWGRTRYYALPLLGLVVAASAWLELQTGYFLRYVIAAQPGHVIRWRMLGGFFGWDLFVTLPVASVAVVTWLGMLAPTGEGNDRAERRDRIFYVVVLVGVVVACILPRIKVGGAANNLIPIYAWMAVLFGIAGARLSTWVERRRPAWRPRFGSAVAVAALVQLLVLVRMPQGTLPTEADREAGRALAARVADIEGEVLMGVQGHIGGEAGKRVYAHQMPFTDYASSGLSDASSLLASYVEAIRAQRFAAIIDSNTQYLRRALPKGLLERHYRLQGRLFEDANVLLPISGAPIRSSTVWLPKQAEDPVRGARRQGGKRGGGGVRVPGPAH